MEPEAKKEAREILKELGDAEPDICMTKMSGILTARTRLDPFETIKNIREMLLEEPWSIRYCHRLIPIQIVTETRIEDVEDGVERISEKILKKDTYKISVKKRDSGISSQEWISTIAEKFPNKVSLDNPDKVILIEVLGKETGIAIVQKDDILSVEKTKRSMSEFD